MPIVTNYRSKKIIAVVALVIATSGAPAAAQVSMPLPMPMPTGSAAGTPVPKSSPSPSATPSMAPGMSMPGMSMPASPMPRASGMPMRGDSMKGMQMDGDSMHGMSMSGNANGVMSMYGMSGKMSGDAMSMRSMPGVSDLAVPMSREGSGTSWLPDSTTTFGHMSTSGRNMLMTHGAAYARSSDTFGKRGSRTFNAPDWYMVMGTHPLSPATQLGARVMLTSDFAAVGGYGYPELFQSGESFHGQALHDHQHPHDLFSEAALTYSAQLGSGGASAFAYFGVPGEPALGPPTYMHRLIAYDLNDAPIGHHWEDATHITFGVASVGVALRRVKLEASSFTGREPNEIRTNFDPVHLDSASARLSYNPNDHIATQVSFGYIKSPEALTPLVDQHRTTASIVYDKPLGFGEFFTTSAVWGQNYESDGARSNAYLLEADYHRKSGSIFSRAEFVQKSGTELALDQDSGLQAVASSFASTLFPIGAYTIGYVHDLPTGSGTVTGLGAQLTLNSRPASLVPFYGPGAPLGFEIFARFRPTPLR